MPRPSALRIPTPIDELPSEWPKQGKVEFIRFIRSDRKLRLLGNSFTMPEKSIYQYVTTTLDLACGSERHNLFTCDLQGELVATNRLPMPAAR